MVKKIVVISPSKFPGKTGDSANYMEIINQLDSEGFKVFLICPKNPVSKNQFNSISSNVEIVRIPFIPPRLEKIKDKAKVTDYIRFLIFSFLELLTVLWVVRRKKIKYALVRHDILTIQLPFFFKLLKMKTIADGALLEEVLKNKTKGIIYNFVKRYEKKVVNCYNFFKVSSESHLINLQKTGFPKEKILKIPIGVNLEKIPKFPLDEIPEHTFGYIGVFEKWQGVDMLLDGFEILKKKIPTAKLYLIGGTGSLSDTIIQTIRRKKFSSNVIFVPSVPREVLWEKYFRKFRIIVIPRPKLNNSMDTIMPMKLIESFAAGKIVIVMDLPIMREIPKNTVEIVPSSEPSSLAKTMENLSMNNEKMNTNSKAALDYSTNFDIRKQVKKIIYSLEKEI